MSGAAMNDAGLEPQAPESESERSRPNPVSALWAEHVESLAKATRSEVSSIRADVSERIAQPLRECLQRTAEVHAALLGKLTPGGAGGREASQADLAAFRRAAAAEIGERLLVALKETDAPAVVTRLVLERLERLRGIARRVPEETVLPDELETYLPAPGDGLSVRLHKLWLRGTRRLRSWRDSSAKLALKLPRRAPPPPPPSTRLVPLRQLLCFHVDQRVAPAALQLHDSMQHSIARCYARLERDATDWSFGLLEADDTFGLEDRVTLRDRSNAGGAMDTGVQGGGASSPIAIESAVTALERLVSEEIDLETDEPSGRCDALLTDGERLLRADLVSAGTPLLRSAKRRVPDDGSPTLERLTASHGRWAKWHRQMSNRLTLNHSVLVLREALADRAEEILRDLRNDALDPILAALDEAESTIETARRQLETAFSAQQQVKQLADAMRTIERDATQRISSTFRSAVARDAQGSLTDPGLDHWKELIVLVTQLPNDLAVHGRGRDAQADVEPDKRPFAIDLREIATDALSPAWPVLLSEAAEPLKAAITRTWVGAEKLQYVIDYNLSAAIDELVGAADSEREAAARAPERDSQPVGPRDSAFALATNAVRRSGELVDELRASLQAPWSQFTRTFDTAVHDDWQDLINQVKSDDLMMERWVGMRTRALRRAERTQDRVELLWKKGVSAAKQRTAVARRFATQLLRRGRSAVGVADAAEEAEATIAEALQGAERIRKALPLVYRRLFSFEVVADQSLLEGRGRDLVGVRRRFERWKKGSGPGTLILAAPVASGRSSFLEALRLKVFDGCTVRTLQLRERFDHADRLIAAINEALDTPHRAVDLPQLEAALKLARNDTEPLVFMIDDLEHVMLQAAGGMDVMQRLLGLMLRTDHAVFWIATISDEAWRYARVAAAASTASVGSYALAPLEGKEVEDVILGRHHRSGMTLQFVAPQDPSPLLKRRLRRAQTPARQQEILQELFFDSLGRHGGDDLTLTMLYWLRSVEFQEDGDVVAVRPLQPISFAQLRSLELVQLFALKAFMVHNTLTAAELGTALRATPDRAALILESLINLALIERVPADGAVLGHAIDTAADRFKLTRVVVYPVAERLRGARIMY
ncbi:MAG: hypothetical protein JSW71_22140 [Gemmatimonadota bacterium]|nr:MAG: hypothetical protein JSW71_22140 [Gemmatimonadota bacterium]